jgi:hypothetical protein
MTYTKLDSFEQAFDPGWGGCRRTCACGKTYYNPTGCWDWEEGELEALEKDPMTTGCDYAIGVVVIEGVEYANACNCWHPKATKIATWLDNHASFIAKYFAFEKQRLQQMADEIPTIQ